MEAIIELLELSIWIIVFIIMVLVGLYFTLISKAHGNINSYSNNDLEKLKEEYEQLKNDKNLYDDSLNSDDNDDDGPIKNL